MSNPHRDAKGHDTRPSLEMDLPEGFELVWRCPLRTDAEGRPVRHAKVRAGGRAVTLCGNPPDAREPGDVTCPRCLRVLKALGALEGVAYPSLCVMSPD